MSGMSDFLTSLQMLNQGIQQAGTAYAVNNAQKAVDDINLNIQDEGQKRQAHQQLANDLALRLTGIGTDAAHIQGAFQALAPKNFGSVEQLQIEAGLSGNNQLQKQATTLQNQNYGEWNKQARKQTDYDIEKINAKDKHDRRAQGTDAQAKFLETMAEQNVPLYKIATVQDPQTGQVSLDRGKYVQMSKEEATKHREKAGVVEDIASTLKEMDALVEDGGVTSWSAPLKKQRAKTLKAKFTDLLLKGKEKYKLGVLQELDLEQMKHVIPDGSDAWSGYESYKAVSNNLKGSLGNELKAGAHSVGRTIDTKDLQRLGLEMSDEQAKQLGAVPADKRAALSKFKINRGPQSR
jgi:hypothetical protein